jgi:hypothetical protein
VNKKNVSPLIAKLLNATTVKDVTDFLIELQEDFDVRWRAVGNRDNNLATINLGSDPAAGVIERVTNAIDAVIELEWIKRGEPSAMRSPRSAVQQWWRIPDGRMSNVEDLRAKEITELARQVHITMRDSERPDRPTVDIRDYGLGLLPQNFASTILSLNENRKLRKLFLSGAFGQGGSTALSYSYYTIIVSRAYLSQDGKINPVGATVVRFNEGDPRVDKHGLYEFLVDASTGQPFELEMPENGFPHGTLVRHVSMDLGKYSNVLTAPAGSLWYLAHNYLFDTVVPFLIEDQREGKGKGALRTVAGNHRRLAQGEYTEYTNNAKLTFRSGKVTITWWVLSTQESTKKREKSASSGDSARDRITNYTMASKPIIVTYNGQKQGDFPNSVVKTDLRLPYLDRYLIVQVDCDELDAESRRELFPTTREALRDTAIGDDLRRLVTDTLGGDPELDRLDKERKQRFLQRVDNQSVENIRKRLAKRVKARALASGGGTAPRVIPPPRDKPRPVVEAIPVQDPPTFIEIVSPEPRHVYAGRRFTIRFRTDADPIYFSRPDSFIAVIDPPSFGHYSGTTSVRNGYGTAYFSANEEVDVGATAKITFEVRPSRSVSLQATISVDVVPLPERASTDEGNVPTPNINPQYVNEGSAFWKAEGWDHSSVAKVVRSEDSVEIFVSADNVRLNHVIARAQRRETKAVDAIKDFYLEHIAYFAVIAQDDHERKTAKASEDGADNGMPMELTHACDTICGIMESLFDLLVEQGPALSEGEATGTSG